MVSATPHNAAAEFVGTALLLAGVVGSGIMGERLADGNTALALLANSVATGGILIALILAFGPVSGAHFNPVVSLVAAFGGELDLGGLARHLIAQVAGALVGVVSANLMFGLSPLFMSQHPRGGISQIFSEFVATFGLLTIILFCGRYRPTAVAYAVAAYITAAYWFTSSTSFANPAVTLARAFTDTFAGIRLADVPAFVVAQVFGALCALVAFRTMAKHQVVAAESRTTLRKKESA
jgi:glycerol uptake facilitator-like aquaporin